MHSFSVQELDQLIEDDLKTNKKSSKLLIGYKLEMLITMSDKETQHLAVLQDVRDH